MFSGKNNLTRKSRISALTTVLISNYLRIETCAVYLITLVTAFIIKWRKPMLAAISDAC